jgi:hypothetical protein
MVCLLHFVSMQTKQPMNCGRLNNGRRSVRMGEAVRNICAILVLEHRPSLHWISCGSLAVSWSIEQ